MKARLLLVSFWLPLAVLATDNLSDQADSEEPMMQVLRVTNDEVPLDLGGETIGFLPKGAVLVPQREANGYYLVEVRLEGSFHSLAWIEADKVEVKRVPVSRKPEKSPYAFPDKASLQEGATEDFSLEDYKVTGYWKEPGEETEAMPEDLKEHEKADEDDKLVKEYRSVVGEKSDHGRPSERSLDDIDLEAGEAPENKPEDPRVAPKPLPQVEKRTEQTLGRGTESFEITTEQKIAGAIMFLFTVGALLFVLRASSEAKKKKMRKSRNPFTKNPLS